MRILILGINFSPERTGIAPYTTAMARRLSASNDVTMITGVPHYPDWLVKPEHKLWRSEEQQGSLRIIRLRHFVPRKMTVGQRGLYEMTWALRAAAAAATIPTDLIIAVVPALLGGPTARMLSCCKRVPYGLVFQDLMGDAARQSGMAGGGGVARITKRIEDSAIKGASGVTTIHPRLARALYARTGHDSTVIYNWTHISRSPRATNDMFRQQLGWGPEEVVALHSGNMGVKQNLEILVDAAKIAEMSGKPIRFVLAGGGSQRHQLRMYAGQCSNVTILGGVDDTLYMDLLAAADVLVINERPGMSEMSVPSKLTSYLIAGRPIIAATDNCSGTAELVRRSGGGIVTPAGDAQKILDTVELLSTNYDMSKTLADNGRSFADKFLSAEIALSQYEAWVIKLKKSRIHNS